MAKKKSLGSSPIEYKSQKSSMDFIPDLGVSSSRENAKSSSLPATETRNTKEQTKKHKKKKVVSYNLEIELVNEIKSIADNKNMYYSSLVSQALKSWVSQHS